MSVLSPEDDVTAGELALRLLSPADEATARARETAEPAFAEAVERWNTEIAALAEEVAAVAPSPGVWNGIAARLFSGRANDNERTGGRLAFWRAWAVGATGLLAASVAGIVVLASRPEPVPVVITQPPVIQPAPPAPPSITRVATIQLESGAAALTLAYDPASGNLYVAPTEDMAGDGRVPHLWLMKPDGGVQLVGALGAAAETRHLDAALMPVAGEATAVAISMEAPGHTPAADKPDGPVVGSGEFRRL